MTANAGSCKLFMAWRGMKGVSSGKGRAEEEIWKMKKNPLWPVGHLPHKGGEHQPRASLQVDSGAAN
ncbi:hypothetical protein CPY51_27025 [Rhizobium tubonense]|uniref:Uncharacterized protein n=1 Tax=Rhizobium tubonense TaxID=484088 RepID=A0A2W4CEJ4_9HYPH|nr:hypothetical protein CPY51_27025 [Rhizobium tubonense]